MVAITTEKTLENSANNLITSLETVLDNRPSADSPHQVDQYFAQLTEIYFSTNLLLGKLEYEVSKRSLEYFESLKVTDKVWILCKNSSTNSKKYGELAAGNLTILRNTLERNLKLITEERIGFNTILSSLKHK